MLELFLYVFTFGGAGRLIATDFPDADFRPALLRVHPSITSKLLVIQEFHRSIPQPSFLSELVTKVI